MKYDDHKSDNQYPILWHIHIKQEKIEKGRKKRNFTLIKATKISRSFLN